MGRPLARKGTTPIADATERNRNGSGSANELLLVKDAERIFDIGSERRDASKSCPLIQTDGLELVDAGLQTKLRNILVRRVRCQLAP